jgi:hypothetical protein
MNLSQFNKISLPYLLLFIADSALSTAWFHLRGLVFEITEMNERPLPLLTTNFDLIFQIVVMVLLFMDARKYDLPYILIPVAGFFFPLVGVMMFMLMMMTRAEDTIHETQVNDETDTNETVEGSQ